MPCYDGQEAEDRVQNEKDARMKGVLCQLTKYFGVDIIVKSVNWDEAGVTQQEFLDWHKKHVAADFKR